MTQSKRQLKIVLRELAAGKGQMSWGGGVFSPFPASAELSVQLWVVYL